MINDNEELKTAMHAARTAGKILNNNFGSDYQIIRKSPKEMVSEIDIKSQNTISEILNNSYPDWGIITEEKKKGEITKGTNWIIDPVDGTHNYIAGLPFSGISIGLADKGAFNIGVIYFPMEDKLFYAVKGKGAFCNDEPISVSKNNDLSKAIVNYDNQFHLSSKAFEYYRVLTEKAFTTRIFGVATNDLCLISSGNIDGRIWNNTKIVDIAAGIVILTEAGGKVTGFDGNPCNLESKQVIASNGLIHEQLLSIFRR